VTSTDFDPATRPLLVGGMHRSGTSYTASILASAGLDLGSELLAADANNAEGFFEDVRFLQFHIRALRAHGLGSEGFTTLDCGTVPEMLEPVARQLVAERAGAGKPWGWKEPRTTLFLDFWQRLLPEARHLFVFRRPWEVVDSLLRRGDETFGLNPALAVRVWVHYNRFVVDFARRHPDHCAVFEISQVIAAPERVIAEIRSRLGVPLGTPTTRFRPELFGRDDAGHRVEIVRAASREALELYRDLQLLAGCQSGTVAAIPDHARSDMADLALVEWARASRAETSFRRLAAELAGVRADLGAATADTAASRDDLAATRAELAATRAEVAAARAELAAVGAELTAAAAQAAATTAELDSTKAALAAADAGCRRLAAALAAAEEESQALAASLAEARRPPVPAHRRLALRLAKAVRRLAPRRTAPEAAPVLLRAFPGESATPPGREAAKAA
jgi:hypothetical protein